MRADAIFSLKESSEAAPFQFPNSSDADERTRIDLQRVYACRKFHHLRHCLEGYYLQCRCQTDWRKSYLIWREERHFMSGHRDNYVELIFSGAHNFFNALNFRSHQKWVDEPQHNNETGGDGSRSFVHSALAAAIVSFYSRFLMLYTLCCLSAVVFYSATVSWRDSWHGMDDRRPKERERGAVEERISNRLTQHSEIFSVCCRGRIFFPCRLSGALIAGSITGRRHMHLGRPGHILTPREEGKRDILACSPRVIHPFGDSFISISSQSPLLFLWVISSKERKVSFVSDSDAECTHDETWRWANYHFLSSLISSLTSFSVVSLLLSNFLLIVLYFPSIFCLLIFTWDPDQIDFFFPKRRTLTPGFLTREMILYFVMVNMSQVNFGSGLVLASLCKSTSGTTLIVLMSRLSFANRPNGMNSRRNICCSGLLCTSIWKGVVSQGVMTHDKECVIQGCGLFGTWKWVACRQQIEC